MSKAGLSQTIDGYLRDATDQFSSIKDANEIVWLIDDSAIPAPDQALRSVEIKSPEEVAHYACMFTETALTHLKLPTHIKRLKEKRHSVRVLGGLQKVADTAKWNLIRPFLVTSTTSSEKLLHIRASTEADKVIGPCALAYEEFDREEIMQGRRIYHVIVQNDVDLICIYATAPAYKNIWFTNLRTYLLKGSQISEKLEKSGLNFELPMNIELFPFVQLYTRPGRDVSESVADEFEASGHLLTEVQKSFILGMAALGPSLESVSAAYQMLRQRKANVVDEIASNVKSVLSVAPEQHLPLISNVYASLCELWPDVETMQESDFRREYKAIYCVDYDKKDLLSASAEGAYKVIQIFCADFLVPEDIARVGDAKEPGHLYNVYSSVAAGDVTDNAFLHQSVRHEYADAINLLPSSSSSSSLPATTQSIINLLSQKSDGDIRDMIIEAITPGIEGLIAKLRDGMSNSSAR